MGGFNKRVYVYLIVLVVLLGGFVYYQASSGAGRNLFFLRAFGEKKAADELVNVEITTIYEACGHEFSENMGHVSRKYLEEMQRLYQKDLDWQYFQNDLRAVLLKQVKGFCPDDLEKRHLKAVGDYVGIFIGPVSKEAELERIAQINIYKLPPEWKEKLLAEGMEFPNELEMLEALDSLDEFQ
ncbi:MAG: hypothetical protein ACOX37_12355 [Bacillota bacterium]|jgi:hypothetical protein